MPIKVNVCEDMLLTFIIRVHKTKAEKAFFIYHSFNPLLQFLESKMEVISWTEMEHISVIF